MSSLANCVQTVQQCHHAALVEGAALGDNVRHFVAEVVGDPLA